MKCQWCHGTGTFPAMIQGNKIILEVACPYCEGDKQRRIMTNCYQWIKPEHYPAHQQFCEVCGTQSKADE